MAKVIPPGNDQVVQQGCTCPQPLNHDGAGFRSQDPRETPGSLYVVRRDCPLHGFDH